MDVSMSLQEDWSPELLNELQRAVPVLESGSLESCSQCVWSPEWPRNFKEDSGLRWSSWAQDARGEEGTMVKPDLLSESAMALPMSTMTSGKRKIYPNRSTFQAHVCCVMDPEQVPSILESLQKSPHLSSVRSWPHAYRIISPFDGQVHMDSDDDEDPGAGEKILGLLERMGLENLLLVVSHWYVGRSRLGVELFRCVTEQCKELLRELQEALRASFPEELLRTEALEDGRPGSGARTESVFGDEGYAEDFNRHIDMRAIGATPPAELMYASRGVCIQPTSRRTWPKSRPADAPAAPVVGTSCFKAPRAESERGLVEKEEATFITADVVPEGVDYNELSNEELERLCAQLEHDREELEVHLAAHEEVIQNFKVPSLSKGRSSRAKRGSSENHM